VVRRELRSYGYSYSLLNGELRSYQEFPDHILVGISIMGIEYTVGRAKHFYTEIGYNQFMVKLELV